MCGNQFALCVCLNRYIRTLSNKLYLKNIGMEFLKDLFTFMMERKKWWLLPMIIVLLLVGILVVIGGGSAAAPFVYTLF